jgi:hypothetical protein
MCRRFDSCRGRHYNTMKTDKADTLRKQVSAFCIAAEKCHDLASRRKTWMPSTVSIFRQIPWFPGQDLGKKLRKK